MPLQAIVPSIDGLIRIFSNIKYALRCSIIKNQAPNCSKYFITTTALQMFSKTVFVGQEFFVKSKLQNQEYVGELEIEKYLQPKI